jgi:hypothetical protein
VADLTAYADRLAAIGEALALAGFPREAFDVMHAAALAEGRLAITVLDRHDLLADHPRLRDALCRFLEDPAPRLPGLKVRVRPIFEGMHDSGGVAVELASRTSLWDVSAGFALDRWRVEMFRSPLRVPPGVGTFAAVGREALEGAHLARILDRELEMLHARLVDEARKATAGRPYRAVQVVRLVRSKGGSK